jgi:polygalacturonase
METANTPWTSVRLFGARGDATAIDTPAVNAAIDSAAARGGGVVHFPAGTYACYTIRLKSNITLHLDPGATILAAATAREGMTSGGYDHAEPQDPAIEPFQDFGHNHWRNSVVWGEDGCRGGGLNFNELWIFRATRVLAELGRQSGSLRSGQSLDKSCL